MNESRIISPHELMANGHPSASKRREFLLRQELAIAKEAIRSLQAVLIVSLEQRGGVPLMVLASRRTEILTKGGAAYKIDQNAVGDVLYSLPPAEEKKPEEPAPEEKPT
jgi:hypothetical protein